MAKSQLNSSWLSEHLPNLSRSRLQKLHLGLLEKHKSEVSMDIDERINVVPYNPCWVRLFSQEQQRLQTAFKDFIISIQHIGSTAVPGLAAKPIIDLLVGMPELSEAIEVIAILKSLGYESLGEAGVAERLYFRKRYPDAFNVHLVQWNSPHWKNNLLLRDFLRSHSEEAARYGDYKQTIIKRGIVTLLAYSQQKEALITQLLHRAQAWQEQKICHNTNR